MSMQEWKKEFEGKNVLIWGYGMEGRSTYQLIRKLLPDQKITIADGGSGLERAQKETVNTECVTDQGLDFARFDLIMKAPGIVVPEEQDKSNISGEAQLFLKHYRNQTIGITGTKGKSTTTSLVHALLSEKYPTVLVGNIGKACFDCIDEMENGALAAFEISCHQLEFCPYSPHVAVYLNLYEEHLDHYGTLKKYGDAKFNNILHQKPGDLAIMHAMLDQYGYIDRAPVKPLLITKDIYAEGKTLYIPGKSMTITDCRLIGEHNYQNLAVAWAIADYYGVTEKEVREAVAKFQPLHHRLEDLGIHNGIRYVNDSISTIGQAAIQALKSIDDVDVILIGGNDRGIEYNELEQYLQKRSDVKVVFMYASGHRIHEEMKQKNLVRDGLYDTEDLSQAVALAKKLCRPGHTVLLSPAASSYDHFRNFEERGREFERMAFDQ